MPGAPLALPFVPLHSAAGNCGAAMDFLNLGLTPGALAVAMAVALFAGFVKGMVGFAMPMIMISALSSFMPPELALAGLIVPTLVTNLSQAFRQGVGPALQTVKEYRLFLRAMVVGIALSAFGMKFLPTEALFLALGLPITAYSAWQLAGRSLTFRLEHRRGAELTLGAIGGLYGGFSGVWGPPMLVYLLSTGTPKREMVRALGVSFLVGAIMLLAVHVQTGVVTVWTFAFSCLLTVPAQLGMQAGYWAQDRLDQGRFRWWAQVVLVVMGLNLIRRAIL